MWFFSKVGATGATGAPGATGHQYYDKGDPAAYDFTAASFTKDGEWRDLDLSAKCPAGTKLVLLRISALSAQASTSIFFKTKGAVNENNVVWLELSVAGQIFSGDFWITPDVNRFVQYNIMAATWSMLNVLVGGYFA